MFCEAVATASQPDACIDAGLQSRVLFQVLPGLRVDGNVLRKCRVVLQPVATPAPVPETDVTPPAAAEATEARWDVPTPFPLPGIDGTPAAERGDVEPPTPDSQIGAPGAPQQRAGGEM